MLCLHRPSGESDITSFVPTTSDTLLFLPPAGLEYIFPLLLVLLLWREAGQ
ncbi:hypothetical protein D3C77_364320 [compost metagenome]